MDGDAPHRGPGRPKGSTTKNKAERDPGDVGEVAFPRHRTVRTDSLVPYAKNARTHSDAQISKIVASIKEFGFTNPVLTDGKRGIVAGHGRVLAAQKLGMETVPVIELSHLNAVQRRAYVIADNRLALDAGWDDELLALELGELRDDGFDLSLTGFDMGELNDLFGEGGEGLTDPDDVPEPQAEAVSRLGDVWVMGRHKLYVADCMTVLPTLSGIDAVVTDPPYGQDYVHSGHGGGVSNMGNSKKFTRHSEAVVGDDRDFDPAPLIALGIPSVIWGAHQFAERLPKGSWLVWDKVPTGKSRTFGDGEAAWMGCTPPRALRILRDLWDGVCVADRRDLAAGRIHPMQKPAFVMEWCIKELPDKVETILDPYVGSGTTIIAAEVTGRACIACEIIPQYCDVSVRRWQNFSGQSATLEATGRTFAETEAERLHPAASPAPAVRKPRASTAAAQAAE